MVQSTPMPDPWFNLAMMPDAGCSANWDSHMWSNTRTNLTVQNISEIYAGIKKNIMEKCIFLAVANGKQNESKILGSSCLKLLPITASNLQWTNIPRR